MYTRQDGGFRSDGARRLESRRKSKKLSVRMMECAVDPSRGSSDADLLIVKQIKRGLTVTVRLRRECEGVESGRIFLINEAESISRVGSSTGDVYHVWRSSRLYGVCVKDDKSRRRFWRAVKKKFYTCLRVKLCRG